VCGHPSLALRAVFIIATALAASTPPRAIAQTARDGASLVVAPGARVRVTTPATGRIVGTLVSATTDSLHIEVANGSSIAYPTVGISQIELSTGVQRRGWKGAGIGLLVGAGVGGVIGLATYRRTECGEPVLEQLVCSFVDRTSREVTVIADGAMVGTVGAIVGALVGHAGRESWVRVPLPGGVRAGLVRPIGRERIGIGFAGRF